MRNVVVTGASRGLGLAIAQQAARSGFRVIGIARKQSAALDDAMAAMPDALHFRPCDLLDLAALPALARTLRGDFGPLYGLVNNAGLGTAGVLATMPDDTIERLIRMNVTSPVTLTKYLVRPMLTARAGRIVNVSSIVSSTGYSGLAAYGASKSALIGFTRSLARELGALGITVNAVAPGFVDTEMTHDLDDKQRDQIRRRSALRQLATAQDVAAAVGFLLSDAAGNITGSTMTVDAGSTAVTDLGRLGNPVRHRAHEVDLPQGHLSAAHIQQAVTPDLLKCAVDVDHAQPQRVGQDLLRQRQGEAVAIHHADDLQAMVKLQHQMHQALIGGLPAKPHHLVAKIGIVGVGHLGDCLGKAGQLRTVLVGRTEQRPGICNQHRRQRQRCIGGRQSWAAQRSDRVARKQEPDDLAPPIAEDALIASPTGEQHGRRLHTPFDAKLGLRRIMPGRQGEVAQQIGFGRG